jgi:hypothetical protein
MTAFWAQAGLKTEKHLITEEHKDTFSMSIQCRFNFDSISIPFRFNSANRNFQSKNGHGTESSMQKLQPMKSW